MGSPPDDRDRRPGRVVSTRLMIGHRETLGMDEAQVSEPEIAVGGTGIRIGGAIAAPSPDELSPGDRVGDYQVVEQLGVGGMGAVYGAVHAVIGKRAAIKLLRRELCHNAEVVERFIQEARAVNEIGHAGIVDIFGFGELPDGRSYYAMEWLRGESLGERLERGRPGRADTCEILDQVIAALEAAHGKGIIHRDLKPDNVFLVEGPRLAIKLLDFGIAKLTGVADRRVERTRTGSLVGTPQYIAPEQARGAAIDARVDVYALGVMAFEMFTGRLPFEADNAADLIAKHLTEAPPRARSIAPELPVELDEILAAMMAKDAAGRPPLARVRGVFAKVARLPVRAPIDPALGEQATPRATPAAIAAEARAAAFAPPVLAPIDLGLEDPHAPRPRAERGRTLAQPSDDVPLELARERPAPAVARRSSGLLVGGVLGVAVLGVGAVIAVPRLRGGGAEEVAVGSAAGTGASGAILEVRASDPVAEGTVDVTLDGAPRAVIAIDGVERDLWKGARTVLPVSAGRHAITITANGFAPFTKTIDVAAGAHVPLTAKLKPR
ncbi:MAG: serine/threonine protein kinase [Deltaproteobacteria bacterium]|nr:serine/threonine protein kinase [Deltaproteobacteria bacterium]